ncbi:MAG: cyanophycin synthetase [Eubacteriales bacterium]
MRIVEIRLLEGANIYCHRPVIKLELDLEKYAEVNTGKLPSFVKGLLRHLPSLKEHYCSRGRPGGFIERLKEGTYIGHVIEHVALELQHLAGLDVFYGKTVRAEKPGRYYIIIEFTSKEGGIQAVHSAVEIVYPLLRNKDVNIPQEVTKVYNAAASCELGPSTGAIARAAVKIGIPVMRLGEGSILQLGYGKYQQKVEAAITGRTSCIGVDIACDKGLVKQLLVESGIPVPWGGVARTEREAMELAEYIADAVVVKPYNGNQGNGVALNLRTKPEIARALTVSLAISPKAIVEKFIEGRHYRLAVVGDRVVAASERIPAFVVGDGCHSIKQLVDIVNLDPLRGNDHEKPLTKIKVDAVVLNVLAKKSLSPESIPGPGEIIYLRENANISTGGIAVDVTEKVHPETVHLVLRAVRLVGLDVAGVDLVAREIDRPLSPDNGALIEINACPGIRMHHYPAKGKPRNVAGAIVKMLFPPGSKSRIPIISVTGTNGKTTVTRIISHILQGTGVVVGTTTTDGISIGSRKVVSGDCTGPGSARVVLRDPLVEAAVFETARGGILKSGLGYDYSNVGIITNISNDHLGLGGIETLADMAHVKAVVAEAVHKKGLTVLNADDKLVVPVAQRIKSGTVYFSEASDNIIVRRHLGVGGMAVFVKNGSVVVARGNKTTRVLPVKHIPCTFGGLAQHNLQNALAAVAGCSALGVDIENIRNGLLSFTSDEIRNPGRFNIFETGRYRVVVDYGHNEAGYTKTLKTVQKLKPKRVIGVVGMPGDRKDEDITMVSRVTARYCDVIIIKEDTDLRGRKTGEVAGLMKKAAMENGKKENKIKIVLPEVSAVKEALDIAREGDIVVIFYEKLGPVLDLLKSTSLQPQTRAVENENSREAACQNIG